MSLVLVDSGERIALDSWLGNHDRNLKLYQTDVTPAEGDTVASYTEATFTDYVAKAIVAGTWAAAATNAGVSSKSYPQQSWTCGAAGNTIHGYWVERASDNLLEWAEKFAVARVLADQDTLNLTLRMEQA